MFKVSLINSQRCNFDNAQFEDLEMAKEWANDRKGIYNVYIIETDEDNEIVDEMEYKISNIK